MGLLDSISGVFFTKSADAKQSKNNAERKSAGEEHYVDENSLTYKLLKGEGKGRLISRPTIWNDIDLLMPTYYWQPEEKFPSQGTDFYKKCFDFFRKDRCVKDKDGWQTYPEMEVKATAKDMELLKRRGASTTTNNPNGAAQFVEGKDNKSVKIKGDINKPEFIQITDTTNGKKNIYTYRKLSKNELGGKDVQMGNMKGHKLNGNYVYEFRVPFRMDAVKDYYILESVVDENGNDLMKKDHIEVYALDAKVSRDSGTIEYNLVQDKDCDGNNKSSMKYSRRAK